MLRALQGGTGGGARLWWRCLRRYVSYHSLWRHMPTVTRKKMRNPATSAISSAAAHRELNDDYDGV